MSEETNIPFESWEERGRCFFFNWSISYYNDGTCYHSTTGVVVKGNSLTLAYVIWVLDIWWMPEECKAVCYTSHMFGYDSWKWP